MARFTVDRRWKLVSCCLGLVLVLQSANAADFVSQVPVALATFAPVVSTLAPVSATEPPVVATAAPIVPATTSPIVPATMAPVVQATSSPSFAPVTEAPVVPPSLAPVTPEPITLSPVTPAPVTPVPSAAAPITSSPVTIAPITSQPSETPTLKPSNAASIVETETPSKSPPDSAAPTSSKPIVGTVAPTRTPPVSSAPTSAKPTVATPSPTARSTPAPTSRLFAPPIEYGLSMTLLGVSPLNSGAINDWERATSKHVYDFYDTFIVGVANVTAVFDVTTQSPPFTARRLLGSGRQLQTQLLTVTFNQQVSYRTMDMAVTPKNVILAPFVSKDARAVYVQSLKNTGNSAFQNIQTCSIISFPKDDEGLGLSAIIGIGVGGGAVLLLLLCLLYYYCRGKKSKESGSTDWDPSAVSGDAPVASVKGRMHAMSDEISNLDDPTTAGTKFSSRIESPGYGDQSVATVDYDYSKAYGGGGEASVVSSAGGTFGSGTHGGQTTSGLSNPAGVNLLGVSFSDDSSFGAVGATNTKEQLIDIYAPPGKLGVVIDTPDDGAPVVHAIKDSSVIADKLQVGDKLVAVDDEDVRTMTAIKVSKLISRKSANATRKLSIIRVTVDGE